MRYEDALKSKHWQELRLDIMRRTGWRCESCRQMASDLQLHHLTYERLGEELQSDVKLLCPPCHVAADRARQTKDAKRAQKAANQSRRLRRLRGWITAVHGEAYWRLCEDNLYHMEAAQEEFDEFLEYEERYGPA